MEFCTQMTRALQKVTRPVKETGSLRKGSLTQAEIEFSFPNTGDR